MSTEYSYAVVANPYLDGVSEEQELRILFAGSSQTRSGHQNGPKVFDYYLIHHILDGKGVFLSGDRTFHLGRGDSFLIDPGRLVTYRADEDEPWHYRWVAVQGEKAAEQLAACGMNWEEPIIRGAGGHADAGRWLERIQVTFRQKKPGGDLQAIGYFYMLLAAFKEKLKPEALPVAHELSRIEQHVKQVVQQLTTQYAEPIRIEELAESLGYHRAYFSKMFKKYQHVPPVTFLLHLRLGKARQLLRERKELTVEQIAYSVGFHDPLYFSKQFKRYHGLSPSAYRASLEGKVDKKNRL